MTFIIGAMLCGTFALPFALPQHAHAQSTGTTEAEEAAAAEKSESEKRQEQQAELERQLADLEKQIEEHEKTVAQYQKEGKTLKGEISSLNAQISSLNLKIKSITLTLTKLNQEINETQRNINRTENKIETNKDALSNALRTVDETDRENTLSILLANNNLSDFFGSINDIMLIQDGIRAKLDEITKQKQDLLVIKQELSDKKEDQENIRAVQLTQKKSQESVQTKKASLLKATQGKETEYQKILKKTQETAAQIRSRIFELLGGGELTFEKAYNYARIAEGASNVRAALILAILNRESLLGKNVGRCSYKTAMHPTRDIPYFLDLLKRLNIDPESTAAKVSCANQHGSYGGAMGPAQFIPSTWKLYETKIANVTKNSPPNPWNNSDAFTATGIYIRELMDSQSCIEYGKQIPSDSQMLRERCAAAKYYAGSRWYTYRFWYGDPVVKTANSYEDDIAVLKKGS